MKVTLLAGGGGDTYYELGILSGLITKGIHVDFIGSDYLKDAAVLSNENISFYNLRGDQNLNAPIKEKVFRILRYYLRLIRYAFITDSKLFHIQWCTKFVHFDRTLLNIYFKILGKRLVFTAHNINAGKRDENDNFINRLTLKFMYSIVDHIIVHTDKMRLQLIEDFNIIDNKVTVITYGINNIVYKSELTRLEARQKLGLKRNEKALLFFGIITAYKGLEYLLMALDKVKGKYKPIRAIIAGKIDKKHEKYMKNIWEIIREHNLNDYLLTRIEFIPDEDIEVLFKAADVLILPYKYIFQSGILFLAFNFGLPVIAADVGSLREFIVEGRTGFVCKPEDVEDLAEKIGVYYHSDLFKNLERNRRQIAKYANEKYSWKRIAEKTYAVYKSMV